MFRALSSITLVTALLVAQLATAATEVDSLVDPTRPLGFNADSSAGLLDGLFSGVVDSVTGYSLTSILVRDDDRIAVINNTRLRSGDTLGSARVRSIGPTSVILDQDGEQITLELYAGSIKTLVKQDGQ